MKPANNQRRRVLIDAPVQLGVAARLLGLWAVTTLLAAAVSTLLGFFANPTTGLLAHLAAPANWMPSLVAFAVVLPIASLQLLKFTHRFAGPVFRLRSELRRLAAGEHRPPLKFRDNDYWKDLAADFNAVADRLWAAEKQAITQQAPEPPALEPVTAEGR